MRASAFWPTAAEAESLRFLLPLSGGLRRRALMATALFLVGITLIALAPPALVGLGLLIALCGHLPLWVRTQTTAPGGATPLHEEVWAPTEDDWAERVAGLEQQGKAWDTTPWDLTCVPGFLVFLLALGLTAGLFLLGSAFGVDVGFRLAADS